MKRKAKKGDKPIFLLVPNDAGGVRLVGIVNPDKATYDSYKTQEIANVVIGNRKATRHVG